MIEVKLTEHELGYIKLKLEEVLDDGKNYMNKSIIEDLYSKLVSIKIK